MRGRRRTGPADGRARYLRIVEEFPRTPSGKIRMFVLRDEVRRS